MSTELSWSHEHAKQVMCHDGNLIGGNMKSLRVLEESFFTELPRNEIELQPKHDWYVGCYK